MPRLVTLPFYLGTYKLKGLNKSPKGHKGNKMAGVRGNQNGTTHGYSYTPLYAVYRSMLGRCNTVTNQAYKSYGGRGISVCSEWSTFEGFKAWADKGYKLGLSIERKDNEGNYEPDNCTWIPKLSQNKNTRKSILNRFSVDYLSDLCEYYYSEIKPTKQSLVHLTGISGVTLLKIFKGDYSHCH